MAATAKPYPFKETPILFGDDAITAKRPFYEGNGFRLLINEKEIPADADTALHGAVSGAVLPPPLLYIL